MILSAQVKSLLAIVLVVVLISVYIKGRFDGSASAKINNYKEEIQAHEQAQKRSLEMFKNASEMQRIDFESALKASEERQSMRLDNIERSQDLNQKLLEQNAKIENCLLDTQTLKILNDSLKGPKK